ncbi:MAG: glycosyltransferase family 87 protein [Terriglobales bacterium]
MPTPNNRTRILWNALLAIVLILAGAEFVVRGPVRFVRAASFNDFISPYIQTRAWMHGDDPYRPQNLVRLWPPEAERYDFLSRDLADGSLVLKRGIPTAYPLTAFVLIAPVAALPWHIAQPLWLVITVLSFLVTAASVLSLAKFPPGTYRTLTFLVTALALAPFHTALAAGSIVTVAVAASSAATWAASRRHEILAALLLAIAVCLKPQIGLPFCFFYLVRRRWRMAPVAAGAVLLVFILGVSRSAASGTPWVENYLSDNRILFAPGSLGDFTEGNPIRFGLINFQVAAYALLHNREAANLTAIALAVAAALVWLFFQRRNHSTDLLCLSALAVLSLLPIYHRFYDASLLIFPLAWSLAALNGPLRAMARSVFFIIIFVFLVPGGTALQQLQQTGHFADVRSYWWWNTLVLPHESWGILILALLLLGAMQIEAGSIETP